MSKVVWISVLNKEKNEAAAKALYQAISGYGLSTAGHFWQDDNQNMAWAGAREDLVRQETGLWILLGSADDFAPDSVRYGLSMLALGVQAQKGRGFPILIALTDGDLVAENLPTPFGDAIIMKADNPALGAKITAKANTPVKKSSGEYRVDVYGVQGLGQWFEVGPAPGHEWSGAMFGACDGEINSHGVGPANKLPERSVVEYPMKGLKLELSDVEYTAWAVQNHLTDQDAYYLRVVEFPTSLVFGPMSKEDDDAEVFVMKLV